MSRVWFTNNENLDTTYHYYVHTTAAVSVYIVVSRVAAIIKSLGWWPRQCWSVVTCQSNITIDSELAVSQSRQSRRAQSNCSSQLAASCHVLQRRFDCTVCCRYQQLHRHFQQVCQRRVKDPQSTIQRVRPRLHLFRTVVKSLYSSVL